MIVLGVEGEALKIREACWLQVDLGNPALPQGCGAVKALLRIGCDANDLRRRGIENEQAAACRIESDTSRVPKTKLAAIKAADRAWRRIEAPRAIGFDGD